LPRRTTLDRKLPLEWYTGCTTDEEKKAREILVRNSVQFSTLLMQILARKADGIERKGMNEEDYADTSWMTLQAFRNGKLAQLTELAELFKFLKGN
jgi:hypothetical protein